MKICWKCHVFPFPSFGTKNTKKIQKHYQKIHTNLYADAKLLKIYKKYWHKIPIKYHEEYLLIIEKVYKKYNKNIRKFIENLLKMPCISFSQFWNRKYQKNTKTLPKKYMQICTRMRSCWKYIKNIKTKYQ